MPHIGAYRSLSFWALYLVWCTFYGLAPVSSKNTSLPIISTFNEFLFILVGKNLKSFFHSFFIFFSSFFFLIWEHTVLWGPLELYKPNKLCNDILKVALHLYNLAVILLCLRIHHAINHLNYWTGFHIKPVWLWNTYTFKIQWSFFPPTHGTDRRGEAKMNCPGKRRLR